MRPSGDWTARRAGIIRRWRGGIGVVSRRPSPTGAASRCWPRRAGRPLSSLAPPTIFSIRRVWRRRRLRACIARTRRAPGSGTAAGAPVVGATRMVEAATEAVRGTVEMATPRLALACQLAVAAALGRVLPVVHEAAARGQRLASLADALEFFAELCQSYPRADTPHWTRGVDRIVAARGKRRRRGRSLADDLETWSVAFMRAVDELALAQEPAARRRTQAALRRIAAGWDAATQDGRRRSTWKDR